MAVDMSRIVDIATGGKQAVQIADANGRVLWRKGSQPVPTGRFYFANSYNTESEALYVDGHDFICGAAISSNASFPSGSVGTIQGLIHDAVMTGYGLDGFGFSGRNFIKFFSDGNLTAYIDQGSENNQIIRALSYQFVNSYSLLMCTATPEIVTKTVSVGSGATSVSFTGLTKEPDAFIVMAAPDTGVSGYNYRAGIVMFDGESYKGVLLGTNGSVVSDTIWSKTYTNGTLKLTAGRQGSSTVYFHQATHYLLALYKPSKSYTISYPETYGFVKGSVVNPDSTLYDGVYESNNMGVDNSNAVMRIDFKGYENFAVYIRSYAENNYDYAIASVLDASTFPPDYTSALAKAHTRGNQQSGTAISSYTKVEYPNDGGEHFIYVVYRKDTSQSGGDDKGYVLITK